MAYPCVATRFTSGSRLISRPSSGRLHGTAANGWMLVPTERLTFFSTSSISTRSYSGLSASATRSRCSSRRRSDGLSGAGHNELPRSIPGATNDKTKKPRSVATPGPWCFPGSFPDLASKDRRPDWQIAANRFTTESRLLPSRIRRVLPDPHLAASSTRATAAVSANAWTHAPNMWTKP